MKRWIPFAATGLAVMALTGVVRGGIVVPKRGTLHVLAIGIDRYEKPFFALKGARADAELVGSALERAAPSAFDRSLKTTLLDEMATRAMIEGTFAALAKAAVPDDTFFLHFSGHLAVMPATDKEPEECYLIPAGFDGVVRLDGNDRWVPTTDSGRAAIKTHGISAAQLKVWLDRVAADKRVVVVDAQRSADSLAVLSRRLSGNADAAIGSRGTLIVGLENSFEREFDGRSHGLLSYILATGITKDADFDRDGRVTASELEAHLYAAALRHRLPNTPPAGIRTHLVGDFLLGMTDEGRAALLAKAKSAPSPSPVANSAAGGGPDRGLTDAEKTTPANADPQAPGKSYALLFATNEYDDPMWRQLHNPIRDAEAVQDVLQNEYAFEAELVKNPTKADITSRLIPYVLGDRLKPNDQLLVFFAGHGTYSEELREGFIAARDSRNRDPFHESYYQHGLLRNYISRVPARHVLLILDVCHGGDIARARNKDAPALGTLTGAHRERQLKLKSRKLLTSGGNEYVQDGPKDGHSPFAYRLLEALRLAAADGLSFTTLKQHVQLVDGQQPRDGTLQGDEPGSDFFFRRKTS